MQAHMEALRRAALPTPAAAAAACRNRPAGLALAALAAGTASAATCAQQLQAVAPDATTDFIDPATTDADCLLTLCEGSSYQDCHPADSSDPPLRNYQARLGHAGCRRAWDGRLADAAFPDPPMRGCPAGTAGGRGGLAAGQLL